MICLTSWHTPPGKLVQCCTVVLLFACSSRKYPEGAVAVSSNEEDLNEGSFHRLI